MHTCPPQEKNVVQHLEVMKRMRKFGSPSILNEKTHVMEKTQENFESVAFYETLFNNLFTHEGTQAKYLKKGDICLHVDVWREPYRVGDEEKVETFMEVIVGKVENPEPLTLSETICLSTFNSSVNYSKESFTWLRGSMSSPQELILINEKIFQKLRKALNVEEWTEDMSYKKRHITAFVQILENYFLQRLPAAKDAKEQLSIFSKSERDFERAGFYEPLIGILMNQDKLDVEDLKRGDVYLYFDVWREPYRVGDEEKVETFMEVIVGKVENPSPLTFS